MYNIKLLLFDLFAGGGGGDGGVRLLSYAIYFGFVLLCFESDCSILALWLRTLAITVHCRISAHLSLSAKPFLSGQFSFHTWVYGPPRSKALMSARMGR